MSDDGIKGWLSPEVEKFFGTDRSGGIRRPNIDEDEPSHEEALQALNVACGMAFDAGVRIGELERELNPEERSAPAPPRYDYPKREHELALEQICRGLATMTVNPDIPVGETWIATGLRNLVEPDPAKRALQDAAPKLAPVLRMGQRRHGKLKLSRELLEASKAEPNVFVAARDALWSDLLATARRQAPDGWTYTDQGELVPAPRESGALTPVRAETCPCGDPDCTVWKKATK